jgi:hypothetical protein
MLVYDTTPADTHFAAWGNTTDCVIDPMAGGMTAVLTWVENPGGAEVEHPVNTAVLFKHQGLVPPTVNVGRWTFWIQVIDLIDDTLVYRLRITATKTAAGGGGLTGPSSVDFIFTAARVFEMVPIQLAPMQQGPYEK